MQLDVVTLFPEWFEWFRAQRHVANALAAGHEVRTFQLRDHTPLSGGQVDDTPFGGGAGMVLRVDVMDQALRGIYGTDPVDLRSQRRVIALTPGGRMLDDAFVDELAAEPAITLLCGRYAPPPSTRTPPAPRTTAGGRCRPSCCPATTRRSPTGGAPAVASAASSA